MLRLFREQHTGFGFIVGLIITFDVGILVGFFLSLTVVGFDRINIPALLTLAGVLISALVTAIGLMLKDSIDRRTLGLRESADAQRGAEWEQAEAQRTAESKQAEARLRMDTSLTAVELMGAHGDGASLQRAGAMMALANLGQESFALGLLDDVWIKGKESVPIDSAVWLIETCLESKSPEIQEKSARLLRKHADKLGSDDNRFLWPQGSFSEQSYQSLSAISVCWLLEALLRCLISRPLKEWSWESLNESCVLLNAFQGNDDVAYSAARAMKMLLEYLLQEAPPGHPSRTVYTDAMAEADAIVDQGPTSEGILAVRLGEFEKWLTVKER